MFDNLFKKNKKEEVVEIVDHASEARNFAPGMPVINILPDRVTRYYKVKSLVKNFSLGAGAIVLAAGGYFAYGMVNMANFDEEINQAEKTATSINAQVKELQPYQTYHNDISKMRDEIASIVRVDLNAKPILDGIFGAANGSGVSITAVNIAGASEGGEGSVACSSPDPFGQNTGAGCINFTGKAPSRSAVAQFTEILNSTPGLSGTYIPSTSIAEEGTAVSGSVVYSSAFFLDRFQSFSLDFNTLIEAVKANGNKVPDNINRLADAVQNDSADNTAVQAPDNDAQQGDPQ